MNHTVSPKPKYGGLGMMVFCSAIIHIAVFFILLEFHFPTRFREAPVYYVDILDLPVANPQAGTPTRTENPQPSPPPATPAPREMTLPVKPAPKQPAVAPPKKEEARESAKEFEDRIARLEKEAAARHETAAIDALRKLRGAKGPVGMPGATGTEAGSDYASYIRSRLEDEFRATISFQSKNPEVYIKLAISPYGRIVRQQIVKSTRDKVFEDSVFRAITNAEQHLRPPPSGKPFETVVKFSPQGIGKQ